jgi:SAM-dependent methyltransferase
MFQFIKNFLKFLYYKNIIPKFLLNRYLINIFENSLIFSKLKRKVIYDKINFYYYLKPMPNAEELNLYYKFNYSLSRNTNIQIGAREIDHYKINSSIIKKNSSILNFGSGDSGTSILFDINDHTVINVDYFKPNYLPNSIKHIDSIFSDKLKNQSFDLILSSHSLEHVIDLTSITNQLKSLLKKDAYIFIEVPNANYKYEKINKRIIGPPHTYYFEKEYFTTMGYKIIMLDSYFSKESYYSASKIGKEKEGDVLRFIGQKIN